MWPTHHKSHEVGIVSILQTRHLRWFDGADGMMKRAYDTAKTHGAEASLLALSSSLSCPCNLSEWGCLLPSRAALQHASLAPFPFEVDLFGWLKFHSNVIQDS